MRVVTKILALILFLYLGLIVYTNRALYFSKFDEPYWKDKYEHSQWKLPLSVRTLGDDGLYLYEGYRLIHGGDPTLLNAEVPPLGKYLIGLSILAFGNGHWYGFIINTLVLVVFFLILKSLFKNTLFSLLFTLLLAVDPLITSQFPLTMLDSLQLLFLLLSFLFLLKKNPVLAGLAFGLFSETKFPILGLPLAMIFAFIIKNKKSIFVFFFWSVVSYLLPYAYYFTLGHNFFDLLRVQKWIASFYAHANITPNVGSSLAALLTGWYQNIFTKAWVHAPEWSPVWSIITPLAFVSSITTIWKIYKKQESIIWLPFAGFTLFSLLFFAIIPFWVRYLVLPLPFYYLMAIKLIRSKPLIIFLVLINFFAATHILFPTPQRMINQFSYNWQSGFFHDIYEDVSKDKKTMSRESFRRFGQQIFAEAEIENASVSFDATKFSRFAPVQSVPIRVTYFTRHLGSFTENKTIHLVKENNQWKIPWEWNYLIDGLSQNLFLETTVEEARRGSILASDKTKLAEDFDSHMIWITPGLIDKQKEVALYKLLEDQFSDASRAIAFHQRVVGNSQPDIPIPMGVLSKQPPIDLFDFSGVTLTRHIGRRYGTSNIVTIGTVENRQYFECCSFLYTTTTYDGISGIEKERNSELKGHNGGSLVIKDSQGNTIRTIINLEKQDGKDVQL